MLTEFIVKAGETSAVVFLVIALGVIGFVYTVATFTYKDGVAKQETAKVCIESGKDWTYNSDADVYECV